MSLPKTVKVSGKEFQVKVSDLTAEGLHGDVDVEKRLIRIGKGTLAIQKSTLFHERIHAALALGGVSALLSDKLEEAIVLCIEHAFSDEII
jgi:hypothetical protein